MPFGTAIILESSADGRIREIWREFEATHVGRTPGSFGEPPHVTFAGELEASQQELESVVLATPFEEMDLTLVPYGVFGGATQTLYLRAQPSEGLLRAHRAHYQLLGEQHIRHSLLYDPQNVVFHCTIAVEIPEGTMGEAIALLAPYKGPIATRATEFQLWSYFPVRLLHRRTLRS